jgi:hypothetical protein
VISQSPLDIFRIESNGILWLESVATLEGAKARVQQFSRGEPGEYLVVNQITGERFIFNTGGAATASAG